MVLADEPSGSLDSHNKAELHQLFFDLRRQFGQTFVIVTHDEHLAATTDRTIHLADGLVVRETHRDDDAIDAGGSFGTSGFSGSPAAPTTEPSTPA